jgi:tight adherence protein B
VAETVAGMLAVGGTTAEGLRLAAMDCDGPGVEALSWLAATAEVVRRSGAPAAAIFDGVGAGLLAQIAESDEREVALAGPRTTARVLAALPLIGLLLGAVLGVNTVSVLLGTGPGLACSALGAGFWWLGRLWTAHLVRAASEGSA